MRTRLERRRRRLELESLETRLNPSGLASAAVQSWFPSKSSGLGESSAFLIPTGETPVHFFLDAAHTSSSNELGYYFVDGPDGRITRREDNDPDGAPILGSDGLPQFIRPSDFDYLEYALSDPNSEVIFSADETSQGPTDTILDVLGDHYIAFYIVRAGTTEQWREAAEADQPQVWTSIGKANDDGFDHFQRTTRFERDFRADVQQYRVEESPLSSRRVGLQRADFDDMVFSVNVVPFVTGDDYSVFNAGANFDGDPQPIRVETPEDRQNRGLGLLSNDKSFRKQGLQVDAIRLDEDSEWLVVPSGFAKRTGVTLTDASLHGAVTVYANGSLAFVPDVNDPYWHPAADDDEPEPVYFQYRATDGLDSYEAWVSFSHGYYRQGGSPDQSHTGQKMYLLAGGGDSDMFAEAATTFFTEGSSRQDIVLVGQGVELKDWVEQVFSEFAQGEARSVTSLSITTRDQANDPRIASILRGADALWFGGGAQSYYQKVWQGTRTFAEIAAAAASSTAIGGTSAGLAILGQYAYIDLPWDSVKSRYATLEPFDARIHVVRQNARELPFSALSNTLNSPLYAILTDTHFATRDRMGRLLAFVTKPRAATPLFGLGVEESSAVLVQAAGNDWLWSVYGEGSAYLVAPGTAAARYTDGGRLTYGPVAVHKLEPTGAAGAQLLSAIKAAPASYHVQSYAGIAFSPDNNGSMY
jgi:cyanophycinase